MKKKIYVLSGFLLLIIVGAMLAVPSDIYAQSQRTMGLITRDTRAFEGYNLFKTLSGGTFHLTDNAGNLIHSWGPYPGTRGVYHLLENGNLLLGAGRKTVFEVNWKGELQWTFFRNEYRAHHDWCKLPNGNVLMIAWETKTRQEAEAAGRNPLTIPNSGADANQLWPDAILEYNPKTDIIVWEWHSWDHIIQDFDQSKPTYGDVSKHPEMIDLNYFHPLSYLGADWQHFNAINYNPVLDQIAISVPTFGEIWIIDHSTTLAQAKTDQGGRYGRGGRLLYRWGNPAAHRGEGLTQLEFQHDVQWIKPGCPGAGNLLIFNNGAYREYSSVVEIVTPVDSNGFYTQPTPGGAFGPAGPIWEYVAPVSSDFYSNFISGAQRMPNGNTVINEGDDGIFFEVTPDKKIVWKYINPVAFIGGSEKALTQGKPLEGDRAVHRMIRYAPDFAGLADKVLIPGDPLEQYQYFPIVDIKPGSCENPVNRTSKGVLPVVILGSKDVNVKTIDPKSILLEGFPPSKWSIEDVSNSKTCYGGDGFPDLVLKWDSELIKVALGNASKGNEYPMRLTGYSPGEWFLGREQVLIVK